MLDVLLIDDFGLAVLPDQLRRDFLEILDDRYHKKSTIITSQLPVEEWHSVFESSAEPNRWTSVTGSPQSNGA